jgi:putative PIN family toxin of toxin-antitoxin system
MDTNVLVSAILNPLGAPATVMGLVFQQKLQIAVNEAILHEYAEVLARPRLGIPSDVVDHSLNGLRGVALHVAAESVVRICGDPDDDVFLNCAVDAGAQFLVTGNRRHYPPEYDSVRIVGPAEMLTLVDSP